MKTLNTSNEQQCNKQELASVTVTNVYETVNFYGRLFAIQLSLFAPANQAVCKRIAYHPGARAARRSGNT